MTRNSLILPSLFLCAFSFFSCSRQAPPDPRVEQLQKEVAKLNDENGRMRTELQELARKVSELESRPLAQAAPAQASTQTRAIPMTSERMKSEVAPLLNAEIRRIKQASDTPRKGNAYGMRIEYNIQHAVYGLVQSKDRKAVYAAKVIVPYEKFIESEKDSRSVNSGSQEFRFLYKSGKWILEK